MLSAEAAPEVAPPAEPAPRSPRRALRDAGYRYIRYADDVKNAELYDERADPREFTNKGGLDALLKGQTARRFRAGDRVTGTVVRVTADSIFVDIGGKAEASLDRNELDGAPPALGSSLTAETTTRISSVVIASSATVIFRNFYVDASSF